MKGRSNAENSSGASKECWELKKKIHPNLTSTKSLESHQIMASLGLRRLYVSSQNWVQPATRFTANGTRLATSQWRVQGSHAKYSTVNGYDDAIPPLPHATESLDKKLEIPPLLPSLPDVMGSDGARDWSKSYFGLSAQPFSKEIADVLMAPLDPNDVEMKPGKDFQNVILNFLCVNYGF